MSEAQSDEFAQPDRVSRASPAATRAWLPLAILAAAATLFLLRLSATDLWTPDEPRYAQVAEEMRALERGGADLVLLRLNGEAYTQKPPLYYWLAALAGAPGGRVTEWAARLPSALAGIATVWVTLLLGQALFRNRVVGLWSAAILLTSFRFAHLARRAQLDVLLALFETVALAAFWRLELAAEGSTQRSGRRHTATLFVMHGALGCAVLTKGPVGLLPLAVMAAYLFWEGRFARMRELLPAWSLLLSLAPAVLWLAGSVTLAPDGYFEDAVVENLFGRFFAGTSHARPFYYYLYQFPADFMPWTLLWPLAGMCALSGLRERASTSAPAAGGNTTPSAWRFTLVWLAVMLAFFSLSAGKRGLYLLPAFPAAAIACGAALTQAIARAREVPRWLTPLCGAATVSLLAAGAALALAFGSGLESSALPGFPIPRSFGFAVMATAGACGLALWWRPSAGHGWRSSTAARSALAAVVCAFGIELSLFSLVYPAFNPEKSPRPIALALGDASQPHESVAMYRHRSMIGGLRYYGARTVVGLESIEAVLPFLQAGGGAIAAGAEHVDILQSNAPLEVRRSLRSGRRKVVILSRITPSTGASPTGRDKTP